MMRKNDSWPKKAYNNYDFLNSPSARVVRVLAEFIEPQSRFKKHNLHNTVVFFGSARTLPKRTALKKLKNIKQQILKAKNPTLVEIMQHGFDHKRRFSGEFGGKRSYEDQFKDISKGKEIMQQKFGNNFVNAINFQQA